MSALSDPKDQDAARRFGLAPCFSGSAADFGKLIADETEKWGKASPVA